MKHLAPSAGFIKFCPRPPKSCFTSQMKTFVYDGVTGATPLALLKSGKAVNSMDMLIGTIPGTIGETSVIAIIIGAIF